MKNKIARFIHRLIRIKNKITQPFSIGVRAIVLDQGNRVLLVKHTYTNLWYLPGGGVHKKEPLLPSLSRELQEEVGLTVQGKPTLLGTYSNFYEGKSDYISIFVVKSFKIRENKSLEIERYKFFNLDELPEDISRGSKYRIQEYLGQKDIDYIW